jgi:gamma-glutamylcysteine synthetase
MHSRADYLLDKYFLQKIHGTQPGLVGVEVELPIVRLNQEPLEISFATELMEFMRVQGFAPKAATAERRFYKAENEYGDVISFDTTWNTFEFSLKQSRSVTALASRFYGYVRLAQGFAEQRGYLVCGRGLHPYAEHIDVTPLATADLAAKSRFLNQYTTHRDGDVFFAIPASTQTHIGCDAREYLAVLNLLRGLVFADACLFANSLPPAAALIKKHPVLAKAAPGALCFRDEIYRLSEAPNTYPDTRAFNSFRDLKAYLKELSVFIVTDGPGAYRPIKPVPFEEYFSDAAHPEADIAFFRPLQPMSPSRYGTIEIRCTCTQPLSGIFAPVAFYAGIAESRERASALLREFLEDQRIEISPMECRRRVNRGEQIAEASALQDFLKRLVACAREGLDARGTEEAQLLEPLESGALNPPARRELESREEGASSAEIIAKLSACEVEYERT